MRISHKILLVLAASAVLALVLQYPLLMRPSIEEYTRLELRRMDREMARSDALIAEELGHLSTQAADWARWDDTYMYSEGEMPEFGDNNMNFGSMDTLDVDILAVFSEDRKIVGGVLRGEGTVLPLPQWFNATVSALLEQGRLEDGLVLQGKQAYLVAHAQVMLEDESDMSGWLVLVKELDLDRLIAISRVDSIVLGERMIHPAVYSECSRLALSAHGSHSVIHEDNVYGCYLLKDIQGEKSIVAGIASADEIYVQGRQSVYRIILLTQGITWLTVIAVILLLLRQMVIKRIGDMESELESIRGSSNKGRLTVNGADELTRLSVSINDLLDSIENAGHKEKALSSVLMDTYIWLDDKDCIKDLSTTDSIGLLKPCAPGKPVRDALSQPVCRLVRKLIDEADRKGIPVSGDLSLIQGKALRVVELRVSPLSARRRLLVLRDITDRAKGQRDLEVTVKKLETTKTAMLNIMEDIKEANNNLKDLDKAKSNFLNIVSHELKTPLTAMLAHIELLEDTKGLAKDQLASIDAVTRNAHQLRMLIENILEISRIGAGKFELALSEFDLSALICDICANLDVLARKKGLKLEIKVPSGIRVLADEIRVREIMNNLINNALKFTEKGSITVSARRIKGSIEVRVQDTGVGIPAEKQSQLFTKFFQVDATLSRKYGGTGLGLSITKQLVELHGGRIDLESEEGKGTVFWFTLPDRRKA